MFVKVYSIDGLIHIYIDTFYVINGLHPKRVMWVNDRRSSV